MTYYELYRLIQQRLAEIYDRPEADAITRILFQHYTQLDRADIIRNQEKRLPDELIELLRNATDRLLRMEPVQYITGEAVFCNLIFEVNANVLIPRPETEQLVDLAIDFCDAGTAANVFEVGSGSGCISISMKMALPAIDISSMDVSDASLIIAKRNAAKHNVDINWISGDFLNESIWKDLGKYDLIVSNPPYIPQADSELMNNNVTKYEPHLALFVADDDPLIFYRKIARFGKVHLNEKGSVIMECHRDWADTCLLLFEEQGYEGEVKKDMFDNKRFVIVNRCR